MPSHDHCCVPMCSNRRDKRRDLSFHVFRKKEPMRSRWLHAIRRDEGPNFQITDSTVVCSAHFTAQDFTLPPLSGDAQGCTRRILRHDAVPSIFSFSPSTLSTPRPSPAERRAAADARVALSCMPKFGPMTEASACRAELALAKERIAELEGTVAGMKKEAAVLSRQIFRFRNITDPEQLMFFTGISRDLWDVLWKFLKPTGGNILSAKSAASEADGRLHCPGQGRRPTLDLEDELLLTLMRLRLGWLEQALAYQFGVSQSAVSRILVKWLNFLNLRLGSIPIWPDWKVIECTMPSAFKEAYPSTFCILDATELFCEVPSSLSGQSRHFSAYKSHTTMKSLVAIAPNGAFVFVSQLFSGAISDRDLFLRSGMDRLLKKVPPQKSVMADRGFEIQDLILKHDLLLNIPPFKGKLPSLSEADVKKTQRIARVRIHVERAIGQVKGRFHIWDDVLPLSSFGLANQMWSVCCLLTNFSGPLIGDIQP